LLFFAPLSALFSGQITQILLFFAFFTAWRELFSGQRLPIEAILRRFGPVIASKVLWAGCMLWVFDDQ
jgi:hypothetical protein